MAAGLFLIAILGCGEGDASCEPVRTLDTRYESQAACMAASEAAILRSGDVDYPVVVAQCVAVGSAPKAKADEVERPAGGQAVLRDPPVRGGA